MADAYSNRPAKFISGAMRKAACIAKKDAKIYYFKPQILGFGVLIPAFVYLSFSLGREIPSDLLIPGLVGMVSLFGASSVEAISITIERQKSKLQLTVSQVYAASLIKGKFAVQPLSTEERNDPAKLTQNYSKVIEQITEDT